jgi:hypothetical protein
MSLTNETVCAKVQAASESISRLPRAELLAVPMPDFVGEYNRTRNAFVSLNPRLADSAPPEVLDQCRYVELLTYYEQLWSLVRGEF